MINTQQVKAARALLDWSQSDLAEKSGLSFATVQRMERLGLGRSFGENIQKITDALNLAGVEFIKGDNGGPGVRLKK